MKHDQAHALLDLLGHKGQQRGGVRAHSAVAVAVYERETSSEQREEEGVKAAHDAGLQRADGRRRFSGQVAAAISIQPPKVRVRARMCAAARPVIHSVLAGTPRRRAPARRERMPSMLRAAPGETGAAD